MMMAADYSQSPTSFGFQHSSPLETLVRRTSSRRKPPTAVQTTNLNPQFSYPAGRQPTTSSRELQTPPRDQPARGQHHLSPSSPLLHSHFARGSFATQSSRDDNSYLDFSGDSAEPREEEDYAQFYDAESVYSTDEPLAAPALRDSWETSRQHPDSYITPRTPKRADPDPYVAYGGDTQSYIVPDDDESARGTSYYVEDYSPTSPVPTVVVSSPLPGPSPTSGRAPVIGKAPVLRPGTSNFSRPVRPLVSDEDLERRKLIVLQRNARMANGSPQPNSPMSPQPSPYYPMSSSPTPSAGYFPSPSPSPSQQSVLRGPGGYRPQSDASVYNDEPLPNARSVSPAATIRSPDSPSEPYLAPRPDTVHLPGKPPSIRPSSPASLYSRYSYYQLDGGSPSPTGQTTFPNSISGDMHGKTPSPQPRVTFKDASRSTSPLQPPISEDNPTTPQDFLQLGITHHEANRLSESASCFNKSATLNGGCGVGMLMWGLTLRHGWGCPKDEKTAFSWLRKAAELAVSDLERMSEKKGDLKEGVRGELVLAIYEVGQCFFHGWGVKQDMKMGVSYYTTAARLGDPDAQNDLGFCLANGKGCKKDRKEAARWYRKAVAQGVSEIGLAWIYKEKFQ